MYQRVIVLGVILTLILVILGAYVRLSDAGLGCPDWPGCYGKISPAHAVEHIQSAVIQQGGDHGPVSLPKAWKEMVHRYLATAVGLLIVFIAATAWLRPSERRPRLATLLLVAVCIQGAFGAWTVTMMLRPMIVTAHLLGGMTVLALFCWLAATQFPLRRTGRSTPGLRMAAALTLALLGVQIFLGGWVSTNYAALACPDFPTCQGQWVPNLDYDHAFDLDRDLGKTTAGHEMPMEALTAIHLTHRLGAVLVLLAGLGLGIRMMLHGWRTLGLTLVGAVSLQFTLGILTVLSGLSLAVAALHHAGAACLVMILVVMNLRLSEVAQGRYPGEMRSLFVRQHKSAWGR